MATRRAAMVLGGSGGIGLAIARVLAEEGYTLTIQGRRPESVEAAAAQLEGEVLARTADLRDEDAIAELVRAHRELFGRLDVLVNSACTGTG